MTGCAVAEIKERTGWKIAKFDRGISKAEADAIVTGCVVHNCPRCGQSLDETLHHPRF